MLCISRRRRQSILPLTENGLDLIADADEHVWVGLCPNSCYQSTVTHKYSGFDPPFWSHHSSIIPSFESQSIRNSYFLFFINHTRNLSRVSRKSICQLDHWFILSFQFLNVVTSIWLYLRSMMIDTCEISRNGDSCRPWLTSSSNCFWFGWSPDKSRFSHSHRYFNLPFVYDRAAVIVLQHWLTWL